MRVKRKTEKRETVVDTLPLLSKCRFQAAQLITEQDKCVCVQEREGQRKTGRKEGTKGSCISNDVNASVTSESLLENCYDMVK